MSQIKKDKNLENWSSFLQPNYRTQNFLRSIFLIAIRCEYNIRGAINDGSRLNGKVKIAIIGCAKDNNCTGDVVESIAVTITFNKWIKHIKFHRSKIR